MRLPKSMKAVEIVSPGGPEVLRLVERPVPDVGEGILLIEVRAAGLNRGDLMQRQGLYPPPPGVTDIPGLEVAGTVAAIGAGVTGWRIGEPVCALLAGGGYAQYAAAPAPQCLPIPASLTMEQAGGLPETLFTCWMTLVGDGRLKAGDVVLIHGGSSGVGTTGIPLAKLLGATVIATAGSEEKCAACRALGADLAINYREQDFVAAIQAANLQVDIALDMVGGDYLPRDMKIMAFRGRHISIALLGGASTTFPMALMMSKQLTIQGSALRGRSIAEKGAFGAALKARLWPDIEAGRLKPIVHAALPLSQAAEAHRLLEAGGHIGKIVLTNS